MKVKAKPLRISVYFQILSLLDIAEKKTLLNLITKLTLKFKFLLSKDKKEIK